MQRQLSVRLPEELLQRLDAMAARYAAQGVRRTRSDVARAILVEHLNTALVVR